MNYYVKVRAIKGDNLGAVGYLIGKYACYTGAAHKGTVFTRQEAEVAFVAFNKYGIWEMELEPTGEPTIEEFLATLPREPEEIMYEI